MKDLGLGYEKIPACRNDCMLFWKENENLDICTHFAVVSFDTKIAKVVYVTKDRFTHEMAR
jgi:hypothetical protein